MTPAKHDKPGPTVQQRPGTAQQAYMTLWRTMSHALMTSSSFYDMAWAILVSNHRFCSSANISCTRPLIIHLSVITSRPYCTQYDRLLAWYCRLSVCTSVCLSVTKCSMADVIATTAKASKQMNRKCPLGIRLHNFQPHTYAVYIPSNSPPLKFRNFTYL